MASTLQRTSRKRGRKSVKMFRITETAEQIPCSQMCAPQKAQAAFTVSKTVTGGSPFKGTSTSDDETPSRGLHLLMKAKEFHLAVRGLQELSGFWYMSRQPKRQGFFFNRSTAANLKPLFIKIELRQLPPPLDGGLKKKHSRISEPRYVQSRAPHFA